MQANNSRNDPETEAIVVRWPEQHARQHVRFSLRSRASISHVASRRPQTRTAHRDEHSLGDTIVEIMQTNAVSPLRFFCNFCAPKWKLSLKIIFTKLVVARVDNKVVGQVSNKLVYRPCIGGR